MVAMDAGAHHVTAVERWLYLSLACKESLTTNGFAEDRFKVVYKRPTDLSLIQDVPILCNLLLCDILDEGEACLSFVSRQEAFLIPHAFQPACQPACVQSLPFGVPVSVCLLGLLAFKAHQVIPALHVLPCGFLLLSDWYLLC